MPASQRAWIETQLVPPIYWMKNKTTKTRRWLQLLSTELISAIIWFVFLFSIRISIQTWPNQSTLLWLRRSYGYLCTLSISKGHAAIYVISYNTRGKLTFPTNWPSELWCGEFVLGDSTFSLRGSWNRKFKDEDVWHQARLFSQSKSPFMLFPDFVEHFFNQRDHVNA